MRTGLRWLLFLVAAVTTLSFLGSWTQPFEVLSNFRIQLFAVSVVLTLILAGLRYWPMFGLGALCVTVNLAGIAVPLSQSAPLSHGHGTTVRLVWANLYRRPEALLAFQKLLVDEKADIFAVTELPPNGEALMREALPQFTCLEWKHGEDSPFALMIATKPPSACPDPGAVN